MARKKKRRKRKGIPWGPGNPLWEWRHGRRRGKTKKARPPKTRSRKRRSNPTARRRRRSRRRSMTVPIAPIAGLAAGLAGPTQRAINGDFSGAIKEITYNYTGFNVDSGQFDPGGLWRGLAPLLAGYMVHWTASKIGINRALGRARVPIVRV